jgi:SAM-dependent methyltransferase
MDDKLVEHDLVDSGEQREIWEYFQVEGAELLASTVPRHAHMFKNALRHVNPQVEKVLNIGIGSTWTETRCREQGWQTASVDPGFKAIKKLSEQGHFGVTGVIQALPFADNSFDVVFCSEVLEHLGDEDLVAGVRELRRVLRGHGILVGSVPFQEDLLGGLVVCPSCSHRFHRWGHQQSFDEERMTGVLKGAGLRPIRMYTYAFPSIHNSSLLEKAKNFARWLLGKFAPNLLYSSLVFVVQK